MATVHFGIENLETGIFDPADVTFHVFFLYRGNQTSHLTNNDDVIVKATSPHELQGKFERENDIQQIVALISISCETS